MTREELNDRGHIAGYDFDDNELLLVDGHDDAIVGIIVGAGIDQPRVCYSTNKIIKSLIESGVDPSDAEEYFAFNILGAYCGPSTPAFIEIDYEVARDAMGELTDGSLVSRGDLLKVCPEILSEDSDIDVDEIAREAASRLEQMKDSVIEELLARRGLWVVKPQV